AAQEAPARDVVEAPRSDWDKVARPWLYANDPSAPPPGHVIASLGVNYAEVDRGAARPFAADAAHAGAVFSADVEVGVVRFWSIEGQGLLAGRGSEGGQGGVNAGGMIGVAFYPLPSRLPVALSIAGGYLRELGGSNGAWGRLAVAGDIGRIRLAGSALAEHV